MLEAIIEDTNQEQGELDEWSVAFENWKKENENVAETIAARVVETIRTEARAAVVEAYNTPLSEFLPKRETV
jgi:hypothetical protein